MIALKRQEIITLKMKDGSTRFCVVYCRLNAATKTAIHYLARPWMSWLDRHYYLHYRVDPVEREKAAFTLGTGLW